MRTLNQSSRQIITELKILQPVEGGILQIFRLSGIQFAGTILGLITTQSGKVSIGIVIRPLLAYLVLRILIIRTIVLSPENIGLGAGPPITLGNTLEERPDKEVVPVCTKIESKSITGQRVTDDLAVAGITLGI